MPFLIGIFVVLRYGKGAQAAAEAEVVRQGFPAGILREHGINFSGSDALAIAIVLVLAILAAFNLVGNRIGRILSWIFHPILVVMGAVIIPAQLLTARFLESSIKDDRIDVRALVDAATHALPGWLPAVNVAKLMLTTLGSLVAIGLLAVPSARRYFRTA